MGGEETGCAPPGIQPNGDGQRRKVGDGVGDEHDLGADVGRVPDQDADVRMGAPVGEDDDRVTRLEVEELVGMVGAGMGQ